MISQVYYSDSNGTWNITVEISLGDLSREHPEFRIPNRNPVVGARPQPSIWVGEKAVGQIAPGSLVIDGASGDEGSLRNWT